MSFSISRVNVCHMVPSLSCSDTFTLFRSRKTSVIVETFQVSFSVLMCAFHPEISSFFAKSFRFLFLFLCCLYFGTFLSTWFKTDISWHRPSQLTLFKTGADNDGKLELYLHQLSLSQVDAAPFFLYSIHAYSNEFPDFPFIK